MLSLCEFRRPIFTRPNFDSNAFPKRAQRKAKLNKIESEIDQKWGPKESQHRSKMRKWGAQRALQKQVANKTLVTRKKQMHIFDKTEEFNRFGMASWRLLDVKGVLKLYFSAKC